MKPSSRPSLGFALLLTALTVGAYLPARHGDFLWDDVQNLETCAPLRTLPGLYQIWFEPGATMQYYPLTFTGFWAGYHLWGLTTWPYHLVNVLLHVGVALLLWRVLQVLGVPGAWLAGLIFALHPVHVMSVAWMTELKNTLSGVLFLGAMWAYLRFARLGVSAAPEPAAPGGSGAPRWGFYGLALALFALALFAKTSASLLVVALLLVLWWRKARLTSRDLWPVAPFAAVAVALGSITVHVERTQGGAAGRLYDLSLLDKSLVAGRAFWFYAAKLLCPYPFSFIYPRWVIDPHAAWQYLFPLAFVLLILGLWSRRKHGGKAPLAAVLYAFVGSAGLVFVVVLYMTRFSWVSDHWQYLSSMSLIAWGAAGIALGLKQIGWWGRPAGVVVVVVLVGALGAVTWERCHVFRDSRSLWEDTLAKNPHCPMAHNNLGLILAQLGASGAARAHYQQALDDDPGYTGALNNLGNEYFAQRDFAAAQRYYERALAQDPNLPLTHSNLGVILADRGRWQEAQEHFERAVALRPRVAELHYNLGSFLVQRGGIEAALPVFERAIELDPQHVRALNSLGAALAQLGRHAEAVVRLRQAVQLEPQDGNRHTNLGICLEAIGRHEEALAEWREALRLDPTLVRAWVQMGSVLLRQGRLDQAVPCFERAVQIGPDSLPTRVRLADAYAHAGRFPDAVRVAQDALALAQTTGDSAAVQGLQLRLAAYRAGRTE